MTLSKAPVPPQNLPSPPGSGSTLAGLTRPGFRVAAELMPVEAHYVRFDLHMIGETLFDWAGLTLPEDPTNLDTLIADLSRNRERAQTVRQQLDESWAQLNWKGAMLLMEWKETIRQDMIRQFENAASEDQTCAWSVTSDHPSIVLATDPALVLNVLTRSRHSLLMMTAPVAYDKAYLTRQLLTADERMFRHVTESGGYRALALSNPAESQGGKTKSD